MCEACGTKHTQWHLIDVGAPYGKVRACIDPAPCRQRAINAGVYKSTLPGGVHRDEARTGGDAVP